MKSAAGENGRDFEKEPNTLETYKEASSEQLNIPSLPSD